MNRRELLDRASATAEERLLLGRVWDKYEQCRSRCVPTHTEFLSPQEQAAARRLLQAIGAEESEYAFFGGYEGAERRQLHFLPDWAFGPEEDAVAALRCRFYEAGITQEVAGIGRECFDISALTFGKDGVESQ